MTTHTARRHESLQHSRQLAQGGTDWFPWLFWTPIFVALLWGAVAGHARVSVAYGADEMPGLRIEQFMPYVGK